MPRKSRAELSFVPLDARTSRLRPPADLPDAERAVFLDIVGTCDAKHFRPSDLPLLTTYCSSTVVAAQAAEHLRNDGPVIAGRVSPWVTVREKATREMVALSMRLRLSPQARQANNPSRPAHISAYERMALERDRDQE
jgi:P27 family predicted phage terminase small subunit